MTSANRERLRTALMGRRLVDIVFHDSHGLVLDLIFSDGSKMVTTMSDYSGEFYVSLNGEELT